MFDMNRQSMDNDEQLMRSYKQLIAFLLDFPYTLKNEKDSPCRIHVETIAVVLDQWINTPYMAPKTIKSKLMFF